LLLRLKKHLDNPETLAPEVLARELLTETLTGSSRYQYSVQQVRWYSSRIDEARSILETTFSRQHSLTQIAKSVGMAPYHFAHIFAELAGMPPHRYLLSVRLQAAANLLGDGVDVTTTCFEIGFNNLSHFTRMFRREFGCSPSRFRILKAPPYS
jgi:AraC-like DNA-binding protein